MRLDPDCIRDILLTVEENTGYNEDMLYNEISNYEQLNGYPTNKVRYHINQCELSGLITETSWDLSENCYIQDLTPLGHEFLSNIRNDNNWAKTKQIAKDVGSASLNVFIQIASNVISSIISGKFQT